MNAPGALLDGRYRIGPVIARGGMSTVHRGTDTRLDRPVAIKVMDPRLATDPAFRARFEREARSAARIDHPAVVDVHDQGADDEGGLFLVMELVEGGTLRDVLRTRRGGLGVPSAFAVLEPVLAGLAQAHRLGLVHRDVKPENVLISRAGQVKVADFGLAVAAAQAGASHAGTILGTVAYLSPEQVATGAADARSDVYAAGIVAYELLTGAPPYTGDTAISVAYRHVTSRVPAPSVVAGDVPPELDAVVARATDPDPAARYADADAFLAALRELRAQLEVPQVPAPLPPLPDSAQPPQPPQQPQSPQPPIAVTHRGPGGTRTLPRPHPTGALPAPPVARRARPAVAPRVAMVTVLALLVAAGWWWLSPSGTTAVPQVVGLDRAAAERLLADAGLTAVGDTAFSDEVSAGVVSAAEPAARTQVPRGSEVRLTVSTGRPVVPRIAPGTAVPDAERMLRDAGLMPVRDERRHDDHDDDVPAGSVLRTDPRAGTALAVGAPVALVLNGEKAVEVPFLVGRNVDEARAELKDRRLRADVRPQIPFLGGNGTVVGQNPAPGTLVERGTTVTLTTL